MMYFGLALNLLALVFGIITAGLSPLDVLDIPSVLIVFIPTLSAPIAVYGVPIYSQAFSTVFRSTEVSVADRSAAANVFKLMGNVAIGFGWIGVLIGAIAILKNLGSGNSNANAIGIGVAAVLICPFYAMIFKYGFCVLAEYKVGKK